MTVALAPAPPTRRPGLVRRGSVHRLLPVTLDLLLAAAICFLGFRYLAVPIRRLEATGVVEVLELFYPGRVSGVEPTHILLFLEDGRIIDAIVTASCSSILSVVGLTALTAVVLRSRKLHAVGGLLIAVAVLLVLNHVRLLISALAGVWWGDGALVLFHDWAGTLWNMVATLGGFLVMVWFTLPAPERAEQDADGRHTARRPDSWARPGLGYRAPDHELREVAPPGRTLTGLLHRYVYPARLSRWLGARRESGRIDYRIGHLPVAERMACIRELAADGLGAHAASLVAVATYDEDLVVLDCLAAEVAARQWEPVTSHRVAALRLWARGWLLGRPSDPSDAPEPLEQPEPTEPVAEEPAPAEPDLFQTAPLLATVFRTGGGRTRLPPVPPRQHVRPGRHDTPGQPTPLSYALPPAVPTAPEAPQ